jgi:selT/selW/selH-like putative selenoprotein
VAAEIDAAFEGRVKTRLIEGGRGDFDVKLDGEVVFSKKVRHRFPNPGEVTEILQPRLSG